MKLFTVRRLAVVAFAVGVSALATIVVACSSDDSSNNPTPVFDSSVPPGTDTGVSPSPEASSSPETSVTPSDAGQPDTSVVILDSSLPDVGNCVSDAMVMYDAAVCNSCYTVQNNPLNACSPFSVNCIPFDNGRVPSGAP
jgi:hypothetical protein